MKLVFAVLYISLIPFITIPCRFPQSKKDKRTYTNEAIDNKIEGRIYVAFSIDKRGKILKDSIRVVRGLGYGLDEIAIDAIKDAPDWDAPTKQQIEQGGGFVKYTVPIRFSLDRIPKNEWFEYYNWKGNKLLEEKDYDNAILMFKQGLEISGRNPVALYGLYEAYKNKGDTVNTKIYLEKSVKKGYKPPN